jgi:hypothetical protein
MRAARSSQRHNISMPGCVDGKGKKVREVKKYTKHHHLTLKQKSPVTQVKSLFQLGAHS